MLDYHRISCHYINGSNAKDFSLRKIAKEMKVRPNQLVKLKFMEQEASKGSILAKQYLEKLRNEEVSIDWAYRPTYSSAKNAKDDGNRR
ncbi:MAG: hypothetical protein WBF33_37105 [Candidatus Nitrosopolaris sp.]